ncbi:MAG TPA: Ig-like domain-containing protein, partial [Thermoanaerobaculia bacterium]|nr:Ig-like domain-containing protein [Thermoanaerobaculia bacterium]
MHVKKLVLLLALVSSSLAFEAMAQTVRITDKPDRLVSGLLYVPIVATAPVERLALVVNGTPFTQVQGRAMTAQVNVGYYIRRLRMRAIGYDAQGNVAGEDEMVVNDPRPPFRVRLQAPPAMPESGSVTLEANVIHPDEIAVSAVDFYVGEEKVATDDAAPYAATIDAAKYPNTVYSRVVARGANGDEANDVVFFGEREHEQIDVTVQQVPLSVSGGNTPLSLDQLTLIDDAKPRKIESLIPASDQPL